MASCNVEVNSAFFLYKELDGEENSGKPVALKCFINFNRRF